MNGTLACELRCASSSVQPFTIEEGLLVLAHAIDLFVSAALRNERATRTCRLEWAGVRAPDRDSELKYFVLGSSGMPAADAHAPELLEQQLSMLVVEPELAPIVDDGGDVAVHDARSVFGARDLNLRGRSLPATGPTSLSFSSGERRCPHAQTVLAPGLYLQLLTVITPFQPVCGYVELAHYRLSCCRPVSGHRSR